LKEKYLKIKHISKYIILSMAPRSQPKTSSSTSNSTAVLAPKVDSTPVDSKTKSVKAVAPPAAVPAPVPADPSQEASSSELSREDRHKAVLAAVDAQITALKQHRANLVANFKSDTVDLKTAQKSSGRRRRQVATTDANGDPLPKKAPSGITKPTVVSEAMCEFMGKPKGTLIARTEVTKFITNYIKTNNLKDLVSKRNINPDAKLRSLLSIPTTETLTYFNLQKYMTTHFPKPVVASA
jgi:chromatin remodeling complex protein RSC6